MLSITGLKAQQNYYPVFQDSLHWCLDDCFSLGCISYGLFVGQDSLINSKTYKSVHQTSQANNSFIRGFLREDSIEQKVWFLYPDSSQEILLYDFGLQVTDSFYVNFPQFNYPILYTVDSSFEINNKSHIYLHTSDTNFTIQQICCTDSTLYWSEGWGDSRTPLYLDKGAYGYGSIECIFKPYPSVYYTNGTCMAALSCGLATNLTQHSEKEIEMIVLQSYEWLKVSNSTPITELNIYNLNGQRIYTAQKLFQNYIEINIGNYPKAVYLLEIKDEMEKKQLKKFIR